MAVTDTPGGDLLQRVQALPPDEAERALREAVAADPQPLHLLALGRLVAADATRSEDAELWFTRAHAIDPWQPEVLWTLVDFYRAAGRVPEALAAASRLKVEALDEARAGAVGSLLARHGALEAGVAWLEELLRRSPDLPEARSNLGVLYARQQRFADAEAQLRQALALQPEFADACANLAVVLVELGRDEEAESAYRQALALNPSQADAHSNLGNLVKRRVQLAAAAGEALPGDPRWSEAEACWRRALAADPAHAAARLNLGFHLLTQGRFEEGWALAEARSDPHLPHRESVPPELPCPPWQGEPLAGRSLVLWPEQGFGDYLQFCRYAPLLKERGLARLTLVAPPGLASLLATVPGVDAVLADTDPLPPHDFWAFPLSLPLHCGTTTPAHVPAAIPYLAAPPERLAAWAPRLPAGRRVGLAWRGSPRHRNDANRSLPGLATLSQLGTTPGVSFVSLQRGPGEEEALAPPAGLPLVPLGPGLQDFADTAAVIAQLDLVITVDTAVAHLAGALGKPVWVLLPATRPDWRWTTGRALTPWYPSMRLFWQVRPGAWDAVVVRVAGALREWAATFDTADADDEPITDVIRAGITQARAGQFAEAEAAFRRAMRREPENADARNNLANVLAQADLGAQAEVEYRALLALRPDFAQGHYNLGQLYCVARRWKEAEPPLRAAIALDPRLLRARHSLANSLVNQDRFDEAEAAFKDELEVNRDRAGVLNDYSLLLSRTGRFHEAEKLLRQAIAMQPDFVRAWVNLGLALRDLGRLDESERAYREALTIAGDVPLVQIHYSFLLLAAGRFADAWEWFEARTSPSTGGLNCRLPELPFPRWQGESLAGLRFVIWPEQGSGDFLQFGRYAAVAKAQGATWVTLVVHKPMVELARSVPGVDAVLTDQEVLPLHDRWALLMDLPRFFGTTVDTIPAALPYVSASPERVERWRSRLPPGRKAGIVWRGASAHANDANRSLPSLRTLAPLWWAEGWHFISLQKGAGEEEAAQPPASQPLTALGADFADFADTAAVVSQLDLVITVDTSVAHLAGAMGKPVWVLLPMVGTDWRWLQRRDDSPWYPGVMRLFRQTRAGDWGNVVARVTATLQAWPRPPEPSMPLVVPAHALREAARHFERGLELAGQQRHREAEAAYRDATALNPGHAHGHNNLAVLLMMRGVLSEAETGFRRAIALRPDLADAHFNLGTLLSQQQRFAEAEAALRRAIALQPDAAKAHHNLARVLVATGRPAAAEPLLRRAMQLDPANMRARLTFCHLLLASGRLAEGWALHDARMAPETGGANCRLPNVAFPPWRGEPLAGKRLVLWPEQGAGDLLQFIRFAPALKARGLAQLTVACPRHLAPLVRTVAGVDAVVHDGERLAPHDYWVLLMDVPRWLGTTLADLPATLPYVSPPPGRAERWPLPPGRKAGLVWKGAAAHANDAHRSLPMLQVLAPLWQVPGWQFVSLQKGQGEEQALRPPEDQPLLAVGGELGDFADTAAVIAQLDVVICVDTAVAHLAGALGKPVWVLLAMVGTDWRWMFERTDSPWYPGVMRLFRQQAVGDWGPVVAQVAQALRAWDDAPPAAPDARAEAARAFERGMALAGRQQWAEAEAAYREAATLDPGHALAHNNLGVLLLRRGAREEAEPRLREALRLKPGMTDAHFNLGTMLLQAQRLPEAESALRQALLLQPDSARTHHNLGQVLVDAGRPDDGERHLRRALELAPDNQQTRFALSQLLLAAGRWTEGWALHDARPGAAAGSRPPALRCPRWDGQPLPGGRLVLWPEQGAGDFLQFVRFAPLLKARSGARLTVACPPEMEALARTVPGVDDVVSRVDQLPPQDAWVLLMDAPRHLGTTLETLPATLPYLAAPAERRAAWAGRLPAGRKAGLVWKGAATHANDAHRSLPDLQALAALWEVPGWQFVSLQKGQGEAEAAQPPARQPLLALGPELRDFADTAAVIEQLDLVVCVDTAVAHLAGALGKPVWVLLPAGGTDWRWMAGRGDSPWYPGVMRLFRQPAPGRWQAVAADVAAALARWP